MEQPAIPVRGVLKRSVAIEINCTKEVAFAYISNGDTLTDWLKKSGPIQGAAKVEVTNGPYNFKGATRTVFFDDNSTIVETLTYFDEPVYYSYSVTQFSNFFKHLTKIAYGQFWFEDVGNTTHAVWVYSFVPKNMFTKTLMWPIIALFYKKFMKQALQIAKGQIEK